MDYKDTLLLPKTDFPMRAELPKREPALLAQWQKDGLYQQLMAARQGASKFILHDGPPFANGDAHMGHALNMVLKDIVLKYHNMKGDHAPFVPGWDCHGLPIEHKVMKELGAEETDPVKIRARCEAEALKYVGIQREQFQRLGVFGDWDHAYLTLDPAYEAATLRVFADLVEKNLVYQGLRPVLWSTGCQTALAEAEIEYQEKIDPAIYVKFPLKLSAAQKKKFPELVGASLLIWTTTPWTLPANLAVALGPNLTYTLEETVSGEKLIFRQGQTWPVGITFLKTPFEFKPEKRRVYPGSELVGLTYTHPFLVRTGNVYAADFVTADAGTGLVHIAPGHGQDDYQLGQKHGLPVLAPVDDRGCLTAEAGVPELTGVYVFKANPLVIELLKSKSALFAQEEYRHEYPHCWRSKTPIVFRAVKQWFIKVDAFRDDALASLDKINFIPDSGRNRIRGAVASRPDWCISRQRTWGIPIPVFYGEGGQPLLSAQKVRAFADLVAQHGSGIWFSWPEEKLAQALDITVGAKRGRDTLDVWIDSGTSWAAVLQPKMGDTEFPADLYLEGSDQHRGWFQSSLLTSIAATGQAPYRAVLTNGFVVDLEGKKLSKSGTGYQKPVDLMSLVNEHGADVLRLWVASQDYQDDIPFSKDIFARVADSYRSIRNTLRILLGNVADFDPKKDAVPVEKLTGLDEYIHREFLYLLRDCTTHYQNYEFSQVYHRINRFCAVELSALYIDVMKDRLYCCAKSDPLRRATQTVMHVLLKTLTKLLAPLLPFTAEETWKSLGHTHSIHTELLPSWRGPAAGATDDLLTQWKLLLAYRNGINEKIEKLRQDKKIGKSLESYVVIRHNLPSKSDEDILTELLIVSKVEVVQDKNAKEAEITATPAAEHNYKKCVRCWKYYPQLGSDPTHPELCDRCTRVVLNLKTSWNKNPSIG